MHFSMLFSRGGKMTVIPESVRNLLLGTLELTEAMIQWQDQQRLFIDNIDQVDLGELQEFLVSYKIITNP